MYITYLYVHVVSKWNRWKKNILLNKKLVLLLLKTVIVAVFGVYLKIQ